MEKGINQSKEGLWGQVQQTYLNYYEGTTLLKARLEDSCNSRWKKHIYPNMNRWHTCLKRSERRDESGANLQDIQRLAESFFRDESGGAPFKFGKCYDLCKDWVMFQDPTQEEFGAIPVQHNISISLEDDEDPIENSPTASQTPSPRPKGRNAARKARQKGKEAEVKAIGEEMVAGMREMVAQMKVAEEERKRRDKKREDRREVARLENILMMQTLDFTPRSKKYFDGKKREALHKLQGRELFPDEDVYRPQMPSDEDEA
uniref:uncharacterized protein LOC105352782 n=1 Tax=Fragaria vesca subsp. vesca TaxID=101020 RepID=UPI0005CA1FE9|nr:PREDICTED: uncharacterized protein LOC105352782 [Fragaria vesca subsp. vesca]